MNRKLAFSKLVILILFFSVSIKTSCLASDSPSSDSPPPPSSSSANSNTDQQNGDVELDGYERKMVILFEKTKKLLAPYIDPALQCIDANDPVFPLLAALDSQKASMVEFLQPKIMPVLTLLKENGFAQAYQDNLPPKLKRGAQLVLLYATLCILSDASSCYGDFDGLLSTVLIPLCTTTRPLLRLFDVGTYMKSVAAFLLPQTPDLLGTAYVRIKEYIQASKEASDTKKNQ